MEVLRRHRAEQTGQRLKAGPAWQETDLVFADALGSPASEKRLRAAFEAAIKAADVPRIRIHDLRHTMATLMLSQGEHPKVVSERLRHATVGITLDTYSHVLPGLLAGELPRSARKWRQMVVRKEGVEPSCPCEHRFLRPTRIPFRHFRACP